MENNQSTRRIHPLVAGAAVSVMLVSLVGVAAITGVIPTSQGHSNPQESLAAGTAMTQNNGNPGNPPSQMATEDGRRAGVVERSPYPVDAPRHSASSTHHVANSNQLAGNGANPAPLCANCGRVESIQAIQQQAKPSGLGVAAGAVLGGILGNQVGNGNGRTLATVAGAVGGGYAGNEVEKRSNTNTVYQVKVRMDDGSLHTYPQNGWRVGDRVKAVNGTLESLG
ncbi:glycine zipper 2TM domain-containing protein [Undibacterium sp. Jales W-56]|uniref:glycine zipper 2TM domain-containing protein n=1 Tax=Undibacterium sp. Jales W-56 TaxID=2897325 RepID=UPI0021D38810|nr:glycine zipper 2TM domain-containing protein [Undibacterium sp. Jales W-56]MCU6434328.1 glycine zipper 2TM domain-containing protein [Undibacterium sp. Jales W-56]